MSDYWLKEAERIGDENANYSEWIDLNKDYILEVYGQSLDEFPESIYEGVLDDDYEDAEITYLEGLNIDSVPNDFISDLYTSLEVDKE